MRIIIMMFIFLCSLAANAQTSVDSVPSEPEEIISYSTDTLLPFHGKRPLRLHGFEVRVIPYDTKRPLYVSVSYEKSEHNRYEYFRVDSSTYLFQEYFRSAKGSSNQGLKASGHLSIISGIIDSSKSSGRGASGNNRSFQTSYYQGFVKQGQWDEYQDSFFCHRYWTGNYRENKRVGIWTEYIYRPGAEEDYKLSQRNYDIDSTKELATVNFVRHAPIDSITATLQGRWMIGCEDDNDRRRQIEKCKLYNGKYGDDCNDRFGKDNHYELLPGGLFKRQRGEICKPFKQAGTTGKWRVYRIKDELFLEIKLSSAAVIRYKIWYLDKEGSMLADRL